MGSSPFAYSLGKTFSPVEIRSRRVEVKETPILQVVYALANTLFLIEAVTRAQDLVSERNSGGRGNAHQTNAYWGNRFISQLIWGWLGGAESRYEIIMVTATGSDTGPFKKELINGETISFCNELIIRDRTTGEVLAETCEAVYVAPKIWHPGRYGISSRVCTGLDSEQFVKKVLLPIKDSNRD